MSYQVFLTDDAAYDLEALYDYIESHDAPEKANYVLDKIEETFLSLADNPERGTYPNELLAIGLREYRKIYFKPSVLFIESTRCLFMSW
ncbi:type II toxin-antitoxin system RelE/ParE family toxin [Marinomonas sp. A3A]|uniref:type II toxin-antitoxin system RelE/ParE family toxin n=1 Tax=Marinomonas sp. A3A TaxID=2065312 RepID=UPI001BB34C47|nr:type II toxin-antitoxin system RelE/ParE family toxin [Marinomonas sp. A3A]